MVCYFAGCTDGDWDGVNKGRAVFPIDRNPPLITSLSLLPSILICYIFRDLSIGCGSSQTSMWSISLIEEWRSLTALLLERAVIPQKAEARAGVGLITDRA